MIKLLLFIISILTSSLSFAAAKVDFLAIEKDLVVFSIDEAKDSTIPSCVAEVNRALWAVSLRTQQGRSIYAMLLTAMANDIKVIAFSAGDCQDGSAIERVQSVGLAR